MTEVRDGQVWRSTLSGRSFRVYQVTPSFVELVGVNTERGEVDLSTYGGWRTIRSLVEKFEYIGE